MNKRLILTMLLALLLVYGLSCWQRLATYSAWLDNSDQYVVDEVLPMTTMDAYYWLKMARELDAGTIGNGRPEPTKGYPDGQPLALKETPSLLAELISWVRPLVDGNYYRAGLLLVPPLAGLFILPLFFYCYRLGYPAAAVLGGLVGSFSPAYYLRTMMGRVDTDLLNLFFPLLTAALILPLGREQRLPANLALAAGAGLSLHLFVRWYQQPSFILVYLLVLILYLLVRRVPTARIGLLLGVFLLAIGPDYLSQVLASVRTFLQAYFAPAHSGTVFWPDIMGVISEAKARGPLASLRMLQLYLPVVIAGGVGLGCLCLKHWREMIPLAPLLLIGGWSLFGPNRFAMYLAPLVGVGLGVLLELALRAGAARWQWPRPATQLGSLVLAFGLFFSTLGGTAFSYQPRVVVPADMTRALLDIKQLVPANAAMFTPHWGYSYALMEIGDFATYHDGSLHGGLRTTLITRAETRPHQGEMVALLAYLEEHGFNSLQRRIRAGDLTADELLATVFAYPEPFQGEPVYVLYFADMIRRFGSMSMFGTWDFAGRTSSPMQYARLNCSGKRGRVLNCRNATIDLQRGLVLGERGEQVLRGVRFVNNGYVIESRDYPRRQGSYLQILARDRKVKQVLLADERLFRSNFNQQYLLGNYDRDLFVEVYNNFPLLRLFRVLPQSTSTL